MTILRFLVRQFNKPTAPYKSGIGAALAYQKRLEEWIRS